MFVVIVSNPLEARVRATWGGSEKEGTAPLSFGAPRNAKIHLEIAKPGYLPYSDDLVADSDKTYSARLTAVAVSTPVTPPAEREDRSPKKEKPPAKKKAERPAKDDGLIDIEDELKDLR